MAQFSTNEAVSLEKCIILQKEPTQTSPKDLDSVYETGKCVQWIRSNDFKKVCLQLPDHLLGDSYQLATRLQDSLLGQIVYVMGDSAYESCCVDYVTAQHVEADAIIHFGPTCFSKWTDVIPCLCIYEKFKLNIPHLYAAVVKKFENDDVTIVLDTAYIHKQDELAKAFQTHASVKIKIAKEKIEPNDIVLYVGMNNRKLMNFYLIFKPKDLYFYDPEDTTEPLLEVKRYEENSLILKRRRFLIEKIKDSRVVGIIIATLAVKNFIHVIDRLKQLLKRSGKTYYTISVGRPTVAKLANFPEMDIYVLICCSMSDIYDSRDFYKPIVTPHDVEVALNPEEAENSDFSYDFSLKDISNLKTDASSSVKTPDVSLITGRLRSQLQEEEVEIQDGSNVKQVALKNDGTLALNEYAGAGFLTTRSFQGLEQKLGETEVTLAQEGQKGIAQNYAHEPQ